MKNTTMSPLQLIQRLCADCGLRHFDPQDRECVIVRSPADYGRTGTVLIEWRGSPPRFPIIYGSGLTVVNGNRMLGQKKQMADILIAKFLAAYPPTSDSSPVWIPQYSFRWGRK